MTKIILIRHCKTKDNASEKMQGYHNDSPFTEEGSRQLEKLKTKLKNEKIDAIFCSDLGRTIKTSEAIRKDRKIEILPSKKLRESDIGEWREMPVKEAIKKWINYYDEEKAKGILRENIRPPGGENSWDHQKRIFEVVDKIIEDYPEGTIVIVGHAGTNKVIIGTCEGRDNDCFYSIPQDNACINIIRGDGNKNYHVEKINDISHLE